MRNQEYVKNSILAKLQSANDNELSEFTATLNFSSEINSKAFIEKKDYLIEIFEGINSGINLIGISGFLGTGKTNLAQLVRFSLNENVISFYYKCSPVTILDDIIFSLYLFITSSPLKAQVEQRSLKNAKNQSIDEKIINYLRNIKTPFIIFIDSFEHLLNENNDIIDPEITHFLKYINSLSGIKLVLSGRKIPLNSISEDDDNTLNIRLSGLSEEQTSDLLRISKVNIPNHLDYQIFEKTRGYPLNVKYFLKAVETLGITAFDLLKDYSARGTIFEEYLVKKIYGNIPTNTQKLLWFLTTIRHSIKKQALYNLKIFEDAQNRLKILEDNLLAVSFGDFVYVKPFVRDIIYPTIPIADKIKIHKLLNEIYTVQIPKKPLERLFELSRKTMHAEQYYHFVCLSKNEKEYKPDDTNEQNPSAAYLNKSNDIGYSMTAWGYRKQEEKESPQETKNEAFIPKEILDQVNVDINFNKIDKDFDVTLTEEEKRLLQLEGGSESVEVDSEPILLKSEEAVNETFDFAVDEENSLEDLILEAENLELKKNYNFAISLYEKALAIAEKEGKFDISAGILNKKAINLRKLGDFDNAVENLNTAFQIYTSLKNSNKIALTTLNLAKTYVESARYDIALELYEKILENQSIKLPENVLRDAYIEMGDIYEMQDKCDSALNFYNKALKLSVTEADKPSASKICFKIGLIFDDFREYKQALDYYHKSIEVSQSPEINPYISASYSNIGAILEENDKIEESLKYYKKSLEIDKTTKNYEGEYKTLSKIGNILFDLKRVNEAVRYFQEGIKVAKMSGDPYYIASAYLEAGDVYYLQKNWEKAIKAFIMARRNISHTISTDSKEKIERRFKSLIRELGEIRFNSIINGLKKKNE